jgi:hypothetical protein
MSRSCLRPSEHGLPASADGQENNSARAIAGVNGAHAGLADEKGVDAVVAQQLHVAAAENAALGDDDAVGGEGRQEFEGGLQADLEAAQVAVVDADQRGSQLQREVEFAAIMDFDEYRHAERVGDGLEVAQRRQIECRDDQQYGVGTHGAGLMDLVRVHQEVLAQHR